MCYDKVMGKLSSRQTILESQMGKNLLEDLLHEKSLNFDELTQAPSNDDTQKSLEKLTEEVLVKCKSFSKSKLQAEDLSSLSEKQVEDSIAKLMELALDQATP